MFPCGGRWQSALADARRPRCALFTSIVQRPLILIETNNPPFPVWENFSTRRTPVPTLSIMSARTSKASSLAAKPSLKKRARVESPKSSRIKVLAAKVKSLQEPSLLSKVKGKERADTPPPAIKKQTRIVASAAVSDPSSSTTLPISFKVIAGSYEKLLYGLEGTVSSDSADYSFNFKPIFIFPAHVSCIKSVAVSPQGGKWLATGSADEIIKVWDLRRRKELGGLMQHQGT